MYLNWMDSMIQFATRKLFWWYSSEEEEVVQERAKEDGGEEEPEVFYDIQLYSAEESVEYQEEYSVSLQTQSLEDLIEKANVRVVEDVLHAQKVEEDVANLDESPAVFETEAFENVIVKATVTVAEDDLHFATVQEPATYHVESSVVPGTKGYDGIEQKPEVFLVEDNTDMEKVFPIEFSSPLDWLPVVGGDQPDASNPTCLGGELDNMELNKVFPIEFSDPLEFVPACGDQLVSGNELRPSGEFDPFAQEPCDPTNMLVRIASGTPQIPPLDDESQAIEKADQSTRRSRKHRRRLQRFFRRLFCCCL